MLVAEAQTSRDEWFDNTTQSRVATNANLGGRKRRSSASSTTAVSAPIAACSAKTTSGWLPSSPNTRAYTTDAPGRARFCSLPADAHAPWKWAFRRVNQSSRT